DLLAVQHGLYGFPLRITKDRIGKPNRHTVVPQDDSALVGSLPQHQTGPQQAPYAVIRPTVDPARLDALIIQPPGDIRAAFAALDAPGHIPDNLGFLRVNLPVPAAVPVYYLVAKRHHATVKPADLAKLGLGRSRAFPGVFQFALGHPGEH